MQQLNEVVLMARAQFWGRAFLKLYVECEPLHPVDGEQGLSIAEAALRADELLTEFDRRFAQPPATVEYLIQLTERRDQIKKQLEHFDAAAEKVDQATGGQGAVEMIGMAMIPMRAQLEALEKEISDVQRVIERAPQAVPEEPR